MDRQDVTQQGPPRPFWLLRSGSGATRTVGEGVEWADGFAVVRWCGEDSTFPAVSLWMGGVTAFLTLHGHDDTQVRWLDSRTQSTAPPSHAEKPRPVPGSRARWLPAAAPDGSCLGCGRTWPCLSCPPR
ncbi:hypothetical protein FB561_6289 [Kribbella amoyensis]|uniref:Uncharacterized protein n=1 Tax=Kribbella amoyensis TaxID=996641 RepID=A0A561B7A0_9ACTN|nr:hypothetical protein [Kribbella amoyensis]TWD74855.1 hypothetical protein FB561_6289 [Kribbella amoyensis]